MKIVHVKKSIITTFEQQVNRSDLTFTMNNFVSFTTIDKLKLISVSNTPDKLGS